MHSNRIIKTFVIFIIFLFIAPIHICSADDDLPPELKDLILKDGFFESDFPEAGNIQKISGTGKLLIVRRAVKEAFFAKEGDKVYVNDALYTIRDCRCRVIFKDQNVAMLAPDSNFEIDDFSASILQGKKKSLFASAKGKVIIYALRLFSYKSSVLEFKTPTAIIGVRGTKFGTEIEKLNETGRSNGLRNMIASLNPVLAQSGGSKGNFITRVYVLEGAVDVASPIDKKVLRLNQNEILTSDITGLGEVRYDPDRTRRFTDEVLAEVSKSQSPDPPDNREHSYQEQEAERMERMEDMRQQQMEPIEPHTEDERHNY